MNWSVNIFIDTNHGVNSESEFVFEMHVLWYQGSTWGGPCLMNIETLAKLQECLFSWNNYYTVSSVWNNKQTNSIKH